MGRAVEGGFGPIRVTGREAEERQLPWCRPVREPVPPGFVAAAGPGHPPAPPGTGRPAGEVARVAGAAGQGQGRCRDRRFPAPRRRPCPPARRRGPRHRKDPGCRRSRPSLLRRPRRLRAGTSPASRAAPSSGSGTACLAASLGIKGRLRWPQDRDKLATGDAAMAGPGRHAPAGQHHGRQPEDRRSPPGRLATAAADDQRLRAACGSRSQDLIFHVKLGFWNSGSRQHVRTVYYYVRMTASPGRRQMSAWFRGKVACEIAHKAVPRKRSEPDVMPSSNVSMIVASSRRYLPDSGHDHGRHPKLAMIRHDRKSGRGQWRTEAPASCRSHESPRTGL